MSHGLNTVAPIEMVEAGHYGNFVLVKYSDRSTACMTVPQFDAIMDHAFEIARG